MVLHEFLSDGVRITFLHSPLVTPLIFDLLSSKPELNDDGVELFKVK